MLYFRNTYKNCKIMLLYMVLAIFFSVLAVFSLMLCFFPKFMVLGIVACVVFCILFAISFFLLVLKNNNYQLKNYFRLGLFNKEFAKFEKHCSGNKKRIREIKKEQKDYFLQFGEIWVYAPKIEQEKNKWNEWVEDSTAFHYSTSGYMEKLSYLTYILYNACCSGGGFEEFFRWLSYEPFTEEELIQIITKNEFFKEDFKDFLVKIITEYDEEKQDELFKRYELEDDKIFFNFESELVNCANWIAYNRTLLSSCVGLYLHGNIEFNIYKLFLAKDYSKIVYIYSFDSNLFKVCYRKWNNYDASWDVMQESDRSIYDSPEMALKDIKDNLKGYIEIGI